MIKLNNKDFSNYMFLGSGVKVDPKQLGESEIEVYYKSNDFKTGPIDRLNDLQSIVDLFNWFN